MEGRWTLSSAAGVEFRSGVTLTFDESLRVSAGCDTVLLAYANDVKNRSIRTGRAAVASKYCPWGAARYEQTLGRILSYSTLPYQLSDTELVISHRYTRLTLTRDQDEVPVVPVVPEVPEVPEVDDTPQSLEGRWVLESAAGASLQSGKTVLTLTENGIQASVGCNLMRGGYVLDSSGKTIKVSSMVSTRQDCGYLNRFERELTSLLASSTLPYTFSNSKLVITSGNTRMVFSKNKK